MTATNQLRTEHEGILTMLNILERVSGQMDSGNSANLDHLEKIIEFLSVFADQCHHGKEEDILFPVLEEAGIPRKGGPIGVMLRDHDYGRALIQGMRNALGELKEGRDGAAEFVRAARGYIEVLRGHIAKENNVLFVIAEKKLTEEKQAQLFEAFEVMEREKIGVGRHEAFHRLIKELSGVYL